MKYVKQGTDMTRRMMQQGHSPWRQCGEWIGGGMTSWATIVVIQVRDGGDEIQLGNSVTRKKCIDSREVLDVKSTGTGDLIGCE